MLEQHREKQFDWLVQLKLACPLQRYNDFHFFSRLDHIQFNFYLRTNLQGVGKSHNDAASVRTTCHIPASCGLYYFEVRIISKGRDGYMGIGLTASSAASFKMNRLPGNEIIYFKTSNQSLSGRKAAKVNKLNIAFHNCHLQAGTSNPMDTMATTEIVSVHPATASLTVLLSQQTTSSDVALI